MKITQLGYHDVMERMGDGYSRHDAEQMLALLKNEPVQDTHDITDTRWNELCDIASSRAQWVAANTANKIAGAIQAAKESYGDVTLCELPNRAVDDMAGYLSVAFKLAGFDGLPRTIINDSHWWQLTLSELSRELAEGLAQ